jgi:hypothetical protein
VDFWDFFWLVIISFLFFAYLMMLFTIFADIFRDHEMSGIKKALWCIALIFFPLITALIYLIARGDGMAKRNMRQAQEHQAAQADYIRSVAGSSGGGASPADQVAKAKQLLDSGAITQDEFAAMKAKALS